MGRCRHRGVIGRTARTVALAGLGLAAACSGSGREPDRNLVAVSIQPQVWLVERIAGDRVEVVPLLSPGDSPATYHPTDAQITSVMRAAVYFRIGVPFETGEWFRAIESSGRIQIADLREGIEMRSMETGLEPAHATRTGQAHEHGPDADGHDPHIWLSPRLLKRQAATVERVLAGLYPEQAGIFRANREVLAAELDSLAVAIADRLAPVRGCALFLFHPSWGYFADEFGLRQVPIEIEGKEPSEAELTAFQQLARRERARVIFVQPQISSRTAEIVADALGAELRVLDPLARNVIDNLGAVAAMLAETLR